MVNELSQFEEYEEEQPTGLGSAYSPSTIQRLQNPIEINGMGQDTAKQMGDVMKSTNTPVDVMYAGNISPNEEYGIQLAYTKDFERVLLRGDKLPKEFGIYRHFTTLGGIMATNKLNISQSRNGNYSNNMVQVFTRNATQGINRLRSMFGGGEPGQNGGLQQWY